MADPAPRKRWTIDRHIPVALIITIIAQGVAFIVWAVQLDSNVNQHSKRLQQLESWRQERTRNTSVLLQRITSTENEVKYLGKSLQDLKQQNNRIEDKLDRIIGREK